MHSVAALRQALSDIHQLAKDKSEYLAMFPNTGLGIHALSGILNITTPLVSKRSDKEPTHNTNQLPLL